MHLNFGGFGGQSILFLIDGERLAGETMDDVDFSRIDMSNVDHIEIVRGASSALYGSNAGGGVINIITKRPSEKWNGNLDFRIGKHGERRYMAGVSVKGKYVANTLSAMASRIESYNVHSEAGAQTRVFSTVYGNKVVNVKDQLTLQATDRLRLTARAGLYMRELPRETDAPDRYRSYSGGIRGEWDITKEDRIELAYSFDQYDKSKWRRLSALEFRSYSDVLNSVRAFYTHTFGRGDILSAGADFSHEYLLNNKLEDHTREQDSFDAFLQYDWKILSGLEAVGAIRYDWLSEGRISRVTPKISLRYSPATRLNIRAAWGMGFRAPTLKERYYEFDMAGIWIVKGDPALKPEQSHNIDISAEYSFLTYSLTAAGFLNKVKDRIATSLPYSLPEDPKQLYLNYINLADYTSAGVELTLRGAWKCGLRAELSYIYTFERNIREKSGNTFNSQYMPTRPHSLTASVDWSKEFGKDFNLTASLSGRYLSGVSNLEYKNYYDLFEGTTEVRYPGYSIWKISLMQRFPYGIKLTVAIDNIFNYKPKYYYLNSPLTDGISLTAGIGITF